MKKMVFDIGGTEIKYSVIDENLNMTHVGSYDTPKGDYDSFLGELEKVYKEYSDEVEGVAMSLPGFIDTANGLQMGGGAISCIRDTAIGKDLADRLGTDVCIGNDGKCAAWAEYTKGSLVGTENSGVFIIGTGVGGGLIIHGKLLNGAHFTAGEYSFLRVNQNGLWEDMKNTVGYSCATSGLLGYYKQKTGMHDKDKINGREFFEKVNSGDEAANLVLRHFASNVAKEIQNMTFLLDLEKVAIGGGISRQQVLIDTIKEEVDNLKKYSGIIPSERIPTAIIVPCQYGNEANQIGAYMLSFQ